MSSPFSFKLELNTTVAEPRLISASPESSPPLVQSSVPAVRSPGIAHIAQHQNLPQRAVNPMDSASKFRLAGLSSMCWLCYSLLVGHQVQLGGACSEI